MAGQAYRIARLLQDVFSPFIVFVPGPCKSAGTLLAIGAEELILYPHLGELGPLDVQLYKRDEIGEIRSGLVTRSAIESLNEHAFDLYEYFMYNIKTRSVGLVRFKTATDVAALVASSLFGQVYSKIDVDRLGDEHRDMQVGFEYACRLGKRSGNVDMVGVHKLVYNYPSHDFCIDYEEAKGIFKKVRAPTMPLMRLVAALGTDVIPSRRASSVKRLSIPASDVAAEPGAEDEKEPEATQAEQAAE